MSHATRIGLSLASLLAFCAFVALVSCERAAPESGPNRGGMHADLYKDDGLPKGAAARPVVRVKTSEGDLVVELDGRAAPATVAAFLARVRAGAYDDTLWHRVERGATIRGGLLGSDARPKGPPAQAIPFEGENARSHRRGTIALWRGDDPDSGGAEFFINVVDNDGRRPGSKNYDFQSRTRGPEAFGYCVFGKLKDAASLEVLDRLAAADVSVAEGSTEAAARAPRIHKIAIESE